MRAFSGPRGPSSHTGQFVKDKGACADVFDKALRFIGAEKLFQTRPGENRSYRGHLRSGSYKIDLAPQPFLIELVRQGAFGLLTFKA